MAPRHSPKAGATALPAADLPPPGAFVPYLHGDFAAVTLNFGGGGAVTYNIFDWTIEARNVTVDSRGFGERYRRPVVVSTEWTFRGRGYITALSAAHALNAGFANDSTDPPSVVVSCYSGSTGGTKIFEGTGFMTRGTLAAPDGGMAVQEIEVEGSAAPTTGV